MFLSDYLHVFLFFFSFLMVYESSCEVGGTACFGSIFPHSVNPYTESEQEQIQSALSLRKRIQYRNEK